MVVEDEGIVALDIQSSLQSLGYDAPIIVPSGEEAIKEAEKARPDNDAALTRIPVVLHRGLSARPASARPVLPRPGAGRRR